MVKSKALSTFKPNSTIHLEGDHAKKLKGHKVGDKLNILVSGKKSSHYQNADGSHSIGFNVDRVEVHQDPDDYSGPNKKAANNQADGGKIV
jgi:hypothetical protein